jgi:septal ring factor EnvC (AmiA/AmiB activator)
MMGRRVREWPRLAAAVAVAAVLLVLIGVVVASASSGPTKTVTAKPAAAVSAAPKAAASTADKQQIASLQAQLKRQSTELAATRHALGASQARARCWHAKARHPKKERTLHCAKVSSTT